MHLKRIRIEGYRASAAASITCELSGRFSLILGANGAGKTTINGLFLPEVGVSEPAADEQQA